MKLRCRPCGREETFKDFKQAGRVGGKEMKKKGLNVSVDVRVIETVQELIKVMRDFVDDERIPVSVREEFMDRVNDILENR